jgi:uncharacterized membrane protein YbjE (DUF340 family)
MKNSLTILIAFAGGILVGFVGIAPARLRHPDASFFTLLLLLFLVGIAVGGNEAAWRYLRRVNVRLALLPLLIIVGTLLGTALTTALLPHISLREGLAVGAGFGYYSLSSIVITELHGQELGVIALLANVLREVLTLLLTPLLVRYFGRLAPVASGGATSMDTTLPVIHRFSGPEYAAMGVFSGVVLTILVPFLVTFFLLV